MKSLTKKGQVFENFSAMAVGIAALAIALIVTFMILSKAEGSMYGSSGCNNASWSYNGSVCCLSGAADCTGANQSTAFSSAVNATTTLASSVDEVPGWVKVNSMCC